MSLCTLTLLSYERYKAVCEPRAGRRLSMRRSVTGLLAVWLFCLFWAAAPLLGWSGYGPEGVRTSCSLAWEERSWSNYSYLILYTLTCFLFPVAVIVYCYSKVLAALRKVHVSLDGLAAAAAAAVGRPFGFSRQWPPLESSATAFFLPS